MNARGVIEERSQHVSFHRPKFPLLVMITSPASQRHRFISVGCRRRKNSVVYTFGASRGGVPSVVDVAG